MIIPTMYFSKMSDNVPCEAGLFAEELLEVKVECAVELLEVKMECQDYEEGKLNQGRKKLKVYPCYAFFFFFCFLLIVLVFPKFILMNIILKQKKS